MVLITRGYITPILLVVIIVFLLPSFINVVECSSIAEDKKGMTSSTKFRHRSALLHQQQQQKDVIKQPDEYYPTEKHRVVQSSGGPKYCINGFSVYNSSSKIYNPLSIVNTYPNNLLGRILLDTYPNRRINIIANPAPCNPLTKCVKLSLGDFQDAIQTAEPYALYGDENGTLLTSIPYKSGYQNLSAWSYPTSDCSGIPSGSDSVSVQLVPRTLKGYRLLNLKAIYFGTNTTDSIKIVTQEQITAVVNATCTFLKYAIDDKLLLRVSNRPDQFICQQRFVSSTSNSTTTVGSGNATSIANGGREPLSITYLLYLRIRVEKDLYSTYGNPDLPTTTRVLNFFYGMFTGTDSIDYLSGLTMSSYVNSQINSTNPYYNYTNITLIK